MPKTPCSTPHVNWRGPAALALLLILSAACTPQGTTPAGDSGGAADSASGSDSERAPSPTINVEGLRPHIAALSNDDMAGRGPGTDGDRKARTYIAEQMAALGLEPAGTDGSWEQVFDIFSITAETPKAWAFQADGQELVLDHWDDFIAFSGVQDAEARVEDAELVFVGYGIEAPEYEWDDFAGVDVSGKVLLMLNNDPDWDPELFAGDRRLLYGRWTYKYEQAAKKGAVGAIVHHTRPSAGYPWGVVQSSWTGAQFELPSAGEARIQVGGWTAEEATRRLVSMAGHDLDQLIEAARSRDFKPVPLGITTSILLKNTVEETQTANVMGRLSGSDLALSSEVVIYGAHHDHLGVGQPDDSGDTIYNGAVDNAAGVAQVLAIAKALKALPQAPKRSMVFAMWGGEEQGLLGSKYYAANPTYPAGKIAANINIDGGNIFGRTSDVVFIGHGKSSLDTVIETLAQAQGRVVKPDQFADRGFFYRSDQFNLARIGVPAIYLDSGTEFVDRPADWGREQIEIWEGQKYHQPSDELDDTWVWDGMLEDVQLLLEAGRMIADAPAMPAWNPGDEFEAARQAALAAMP